MAIIKRANQEDGAAWLELRCALWPEGARDQHRAEIQQFFAGELPEPLAVLLAFDSHEQAVGLAELSIRAYAEGCRSAPVGYLEGWYVAPAVRRQGIGRALLAAAEDWARAQGCQEFASDTQPDNTVSAAAHRALGFEEVGGLRCFRKDLRSGAAA